MKILNVRGTTVDYGTDWTEFRRWIDGSVAALPIAWADSPAGYDLVAVDGPVFRVAAVLKTDPQNPAQVDFETNWRDVVRPCSRTSDGAVIVRQDAGTETTDPRFYGAAVVVPGAVGDSWHDLAVPVGARLQYVVVQVRGPVFGDRIEVAFRSDGNVEGYGPEGAIVQTFGEINPPMHTDARGWTAARREPNDLGSAKAIPYGVKVSIRYACADASGRELLIDCCCHE